MSRRLWDAILADDPARLISQLRENALDIDLADTEKDQLAPLHFAASQPAPRCLLVLLAFGADPNRARRYDTTPLHDAVMTASRDAGVGVRALIDAGADPLAQSRTGLTPLGLANTIADFPSDALEALRDAAGATIRIDARPTELHDAITAGTVEAAAAALLVDSTGVNAFDPSLRTPLQVTVERSPRIGGPSRRIEHPLDIQDAAHIVRLLLEAGADPGVIDPAGRSVMDRYGSGGYDLDESIRQPIQSAFERLYDQRKAAGVRPEWNPAAPARSTRPNVNASPAPWEGFPRDLRRTGEQWDRIVTGEAVGVHDVAAEPMSRLRAALRLMSAMYSRGDTIDALRGEFRVLADCYLAAEWSGRGQRAPWSPAKAPRWKADVAAYRDALTVIGWAVALDAPADQVAPVAAVAAARGRDQLLEHLVAFPDVDGPPPKSARLPVYGPMADTFAHQGSGGSEDAVSKLQKYLLRWEPSWGPAPEGAYVGRVAPEAAAIVRLLNLEDRHLYADGPYPRDLARWEANAISEHPARRRGLLGNWFGRHAT